MLEKQTSQTLENRAIRILREAALEKGETLTPRQEAIAIQAIHTWSLKEAKSGVEWSPWEILRAQAVLSDDTFLVELADYLQQHMPQFSLDSEANPPVVYVANASAHTFDAAEKYGEIRILTDGYYGPKRMERLLFELTRNLRNFNEQRDSYVPCGPDVVNFAAGYVLGKLGVNRVTAMMWDAKAKEYKQAVLDARAIQSTLDNIQRLIDQQQQENIP